MEKIRTLIWDISGPLGCYINNGVRTKDTYYIPPINSIIGTIGAICGYKKDEYIEKIVSDETKIAISILSDIKKISKNFNRIFKGKEKGSLLETIYFLENPKFRIYFSSHEKIMDELLYRLKNNICHYPIYLGLSECGGEFCFIDDAELILNQSLCFVNSVIPFSYRDNIKNIVDPGFITSDRCVHTFLDKNRYVLKREDVIVFVDDKNKVQMQSDTGIYTYNNNIEEKNVIFFDRK